MTDGRRGAPTLDRGRQSLHRGGGLWGLGSLAGAQEFAPVELSTARDKLQRAEKAAADHDAQPATMLAEQANVDAELAEATAQEHRSQKAESELQASLQALREQANQSSATATPPPVAPQPSNQ